MKSDLHIDFVREVLALDQSGRLVWLKKPSLRSQAVPGEVAGAPAGPYRTVYLKGASRYVHILVWALSHGRMPGDREEIDHQDGNQANDAPDNLRLKSHAENIQNQLRPHVDSKSGFLGVSAHRRKWKAQICAHGVRRSLGNFDTPQKAHAAYLSAKRQLHAGAAL